MKILVVSPYRGIGDLIFHLPLFRYLNKKYKTKINLITVHNSKAKYILKKESYISKIVYGDFNRQQIFNKIVKLKNEINKFKSDLTIVSASSKRLVASLILSNSKKKIFFSKSSEKDLSKYIYKETKKIFNLSSLEKSYQLNFSKNIKKEKKNIFLNIDSFHNQNNWGENNYLNLILELLKKKFKLFVNFSPKHKKKFKKIIFMFKNKQNIEFTYNKNFKDILKIIQNSNYVVGNESGPICIGASLRKKVLSIYNPTTTPRSSKTIYKNVIFINAKRVKHDLIKKRIINFTK
tara:strand:+ start:624 stop:1499 length:876 start_codon:yes stop_codon:yes gene_type:complete